MMRSPIAQINRIIIEAIPRPRAAPARPADVVDLCITSDDAPKPLRRQNSISILNIINIHLIMFPKSERFGFDVVVPHFAQLRA